MDDLNQRTQPVPDDTPNNHYPTTEDASRHSRANQDEQDVSGTTPHVASDDDVDDMNHRVFGQTPSQTDEVPNIADQINDAEQAIKNQ